MFFVAYFVFRLLRDEAISVRRAAAEAMQHLGPCAAGCGSELAEVVRSEDDADVRRMAAEALGYLGEHARSAAADLAKALGDPDATVRVAAAEALGRLGHHAEARRHDFCGLSTQIRSHNRLRGSLAILGFLRFRWFSFVVLGFSLVFLG